MALDTVATEEAFVYIFACVTAGTVQKSRRQILRLFGTYRSRRGFPLARPTVQMLHGTDLSGVHLRRPLQRVDLEPSQMAVIHPGNRRIPATVLDMTPAAAADRRMKDRLGPDQETLVGRMACNAVDAVRALYGGVAGLTILFEARVCRRKSARRRHPLPGSGVLRPEVVGRQNPTRTEGATPKKQEEPNLAPALHDY